MLEPDDIQLLKGRSHGHFVTLNPDGSPQVTPVWVDADDQGHVLVNTASGRKKDRNVRRDPRVAISVQDHDDPYRWLSVTGTVVDITEGPKALDHIAALSLIYTGTPWETVQGQARLIYLIRPDRVARNEG